ncbi:MAG TPA: sigma-70 family RNA polymerase sigma factor [Bryobacteraceae bacterium]|nr:sigma-70 family RNA polymerase sigma factor [Bryobacteraceae bacterium]
MLVTKEPSTTTDDALVRAAAEGDRRAFGELYVRYARMVHGILLARVPPGDAEDLVQDVFLAAMKQLGDLRSAAAFRGWLGAIARSRAIDYFRSRGRQPVAEPPPNTAHSTGGRQEAFEILDLIRSLPEAYRETLILRLVEGLTGPEIARQTGLTPESVRVNLCRGMKMLRQRWEGGESK